MLRTHRAASRPSVPPRLALYQRRRLFCISCLLRCSAAPPLCSFVFNQNSLFQRIDLSFDKTQSLYFSKMAHAITRTETLGARSVQVCLHLYKVSLNFLQFE